MKIFEVGVPDQRKAPFAHTYGPLPDMPFFEGLEAFRESFEEYWEVNPISPGMMIDRGGWEWSDFILNGNSPPYFFVSQRIVDSLEREGIPIYRKTLMPIAGIESKKLKELEPPSYYVLEGIPAASLDFSAMGVAVDERGQPRWTSLQLKARPPFVFDGLSWDGLDLFSLRNLGSTIGLYCTERIVDLAEKEKWTNCDFKPVGG